MVRMRIIVIVALLHVMRHGLNYERDTAQATTNDETTENWRSTKPKLYFERKCYVFESDDQTESQRIADDLLNLSSGISACLAHHQRIYDFDPHQNLVRNIERKPKLSTTVSFANMKIYLILVVVRPQDAIITSTHL